MIQGSMVALVTPMDANGALDWDNLYKLVDWHLEQGTDAIVAMGTTGESATLSVDEHMAVVKAVIERVNGRIPVIAGTGANATAEAVELTQAAKQLGADACLLVTPYYNKPTQEGLYQHFAHVAAAVDVPQILYNVPGRTGVDMSAETALRLAALDNIIGIKEATGDVDRARAIIAAAPEGFAIYSGDDETAVELILAGGHGDISVTANVAPAALSKACALAIQGQADEARALQDKLMPLHAAMFVESNPIPVKWAVAEMGLIQHGLRLPMTHLDQRYHAQVREALANAGCL
ncbi:MAG: 4-hydroxy-tetrahydrodipicolinate synthase [Cellvibrionaceae bacterium]|nr:4-hydroxy-tetrahydrodipicolinate synthase [Cellvibrionaceae bacterium]